MNDDYKKGWTDAMGWRTENHLEHLPEQKPYAFEASMYSNDRVKIDPVTGNLSIGTVPHLTPPCPKDLFQFECSVEDVDLVCFLEYSPAEKGSTDSYGAPYEPDLEESMTLNNAYIMDTDVDVAHMLLQSLVDHIEVSALEKYNDK
jgi:hypothetical protein